MIFAVVGSVELPSHFHGGLRVLTVKNAPAATAEICALEWLTAWEIALSEVSSRCQCERRQAVKEAQAELKDSGRQRPNGCGAGSARPWPSSSVWLARMRGSPRVCGRICGNVS